jgi:hypothetical protein
MVHLEVVLGNCGRAYFNDNGEALCGKGLI